MKQFCRYVVLLEDSGRVLSSGEKWKDFERANCVKSGSFRTFPLIGRKLTCYYRLVFILGRWCTIVYWANAPVSEVCNFVTVLGRRVGLRGSALANDYPCLMRYYKHLLRVLY